LFKTVSKLKMEHKKAKGKTGYTKYEHSRIVGARALQISQGAPFMLKLSEKDLERVGYNPLEIAKIEFDEGLIPITVKKASHEKKGVESSGKN
jgi:DNA-directed RNA polymerase subunit K